MVLPIEFHKRLWTLSTVGALLLIPAAVVMLVAQSAAVTGALREGLRFESVQHLLLTRWGLIWAVRNSRDRRGRGAGAPSSPPGAVGLVAMALSAALDRHHFTERASGRDAAGLVITDRGLGPYRGQRDVDWRPVCACHGHAPVGVDARPAAAESEARRHRPAVLDDGADLRAGAVRHRGVSTRGRT